ncbi:hypothetical protein PVK06_038869 [Gossypium arboreum]|uniref:Uncharacterized protein n=1 Tax=Gossypium arboreum TaxID=29729 RepID=A0ABR0N1C2_GOSAR|nr:hypothetical protein PVK06_038869 [Gossypium arboreum]
MFSCFHSLKGLPAVVHAEWVALLIWWQIDSSPSTYETTRSPTKKTSLAAIHPKMGGCSSSYQKLSLPMMFNIFNPLQPQYYTPPEQTFVTHDFSNLLSTPRGLPMGDRNVGLSEMDINGREHPQHERRPPQRYTS